ncbi:MAG: RHS repeat protein, partial [Paenibacillaceae bacterium]|nr:RHS repeat protein [Paenibacillaceae bacterium]
MSSNVGCQRDYTYNSSGQLLTASTQITLGEGLSPISTTLSYEYDTFGRLVSTEYPDSTKVEFDSFDFLDRPLAQTIIPVGGDNRTTTISYEDNLRKVSVTSPNQDKQTSKYSPFGQLVESIQSVLDSTYETKSRTVSKKAYDPTSRSVVISIPYNESSFQTVSIYDSFGRLSSVTAPLGLTTTYAYANVARNISTGTKTLQKVTQSVENDGKTEISYYDPFGRLQKVIVKSPDDLKKRTTTIAYNTVGQATYKSISSGTVTQTTYYNYDGWGDLLYVKDNTGQEYQYNYNRFGLVTSQQVEGSLIRQTSYNEVGWA